MIRLLDAGQRRGATCCVGRDELTGETVIIDGVPLERTARLRTSTRPARCCWSARASNSSTAAERRFYGGIETLTDWTGTTEQRNDSPVNFAFPGEAGFAATTPNMIATCRWSGPRPPAPQPARP